MQLIPVITVDGPSGAGKTTIIQLIQRFYDPQSGRILLDGVDVAQMEREAFRKHIALVPQDPVIFAASAYENIGFGRPDATQTEIEAAVFRRLLKHLDEHKEVQNIDLMILADFCRNCLAKWMVAEAEERSVEIDYEQARERIYGMPYSEWKAKHQTEASPEQQAAFAKSFKENVTDKEG